MSSLVVAVLPLMAGVAGNEERFFKDRDLFKDIQEFKPAKDIEKRLKDGANINARDEGVDQKGKPLYVRNNGETPLLLASWYYAELRSGLRLKSDKDLDQSEKAIFERLTQTIKSLMAWEGSPAGSPLGREGASLLAADNRGNTVLMHLATAGDVDLAKELLDKITDPAQRKVYIDVRDRAGWTPDGAGGAGRGGTALLRAIYENRPKMADFLLRSGADMGLEDDPESRWARSAFPWALYQVEHRPDEDFSAVIATLAVRAPSQMNQPDSQGNTPLLHQIVKGRSHWRVKTALALLEGSNIVVNTPNANTGCTALVEASRRKEMLEVVRVISQRSGADPNLACYDGTTALIAAAEIGFAGALDLILEMPNVDADAYFRGTALTYAVKSGDQASVEAMLWRRDEKGNLSARKNVNPNMLDSQANPALVLVVERKDMGMLEAFLKRPDLDLNNPSPRGTAYSSAVYYGWVQGACALLRDPRLNASPTDLERKVCGLDTSRGTP